MRWQVGRNAVSQTAFATLQAAELAKFNAMREGMAIMQTGIDNVRLSRALTNRALF
jgi:hypothetical protein